MSREQRAIDLIVDVAAQFEATAIDRKTIEATFEVKVRRADSRQVRYRIQAYARDTEVWVKEDGTNHLPAFCPDRHINDDGSFCMYWGDEYAIRVVDSAAAICWWETLQEFLRLQERTAYARRWIGDGWAHGEAARHQYRTQQAALTLGKRFVTAIRYPRLAVESVRTKNPANSMTLLLLLDGIPICWVRKGKKHITGRQLNRRFRLRHTGTSMKRLSARSVQAHAYAQLANELWNWKNKEEAYWKGFSTHKCCGTLDSCRLRIQEQQKETTHV